MHNEDPPISYDPGDSAWKDSPEIILATVVPEPVSEAQATAPRRRKWKLALALFVATCLSTLLIGGWVYAACLMTILVCHETGHFLQARRYGVYAGYPIFLPLPLPPIGTLGAVIVMDSRIPHRKSLFDIGITGPLAGLVPTLICCVLGIMFDARLAVATQGGWQLGEPLLFKWLAYMRFGTIPDGADVYMGPVAMAGWVGLLITALNLMPIGQLDGGHVLYALVRRGQHIVATLLLLTAIAMIFYSPATLAGWTIMLLLLVVMGPKHPPTWNDYAPLGRGRTILGWLTLAFLFVGFTPQPIVDIRLPESPKPKVETIEVRNDRPWESERLAALQLPSDFSGAGMRPPKWTNCSLAPELRTSRTGVAPNRPPKFT